MAFVIEKEFVLLCEGPADQTFLSKLLEARKIADFDIPPHSDLGRFYGVSGIGKMLRSLAGDAAGYAKLKGVLVIPDSANDVLTTFDAICEKLRDDGPFVAPAAFSRPAGPTQVQRQPEGHPFLSIMPIPLGRAGSLETLCVEDIIRRRPWIRECVETYLGCGNIKVFGWPPEKQGKARLQCIIAALNAEDPNKGLANLLHVVPSFFDFKSPVFTPLVKEIRKFLSTVKGIS